LTSAIEEEIAHLKHSTPNLLLDEARPLCNKTAIAAADFFA
jgi:hypothetical protein